MRAECMRRETWGNGMIKSANGRATGIFGSLRSWIWSSHGEAKLSGSYQREAVADYFFHEWSIHLGLEAVMI